ncbi:hypothetical protein MUK42_33069 [Musa troglodytarum]|uniref:Uncharacterized protein n=1 Tax=Musa troglodytarum TaxID=320322 RepID=A0A9E7LBS2_9LILI|nr:hypothetical protein MUK42_33069 [Musa troglodytarum]
MQTYDAFFVLSVIYLNRMKGKGTQLSHCLGIAAPEVLSVRKASLVILNNDASARSSLSTKDAGIDVKDCAKLRVSVGRWCKRLLDRIRSGGVQGLVGARIYALADELLAEEAVEAEDEIFLIGCDGTMLDGGAEVVHPSEAAALAAAAEPSALGQRPPPPLPLPPHEARQHLVLLRRPRAPLQTHFAAARRRPSTPPALHLHRRRR